MAEALLALFQNTDYRVCPNDQGIDPAHPVPAAVLAYLDEMDRHATTQASAAHTRPAPVALALPWASAAHARPAPAALAHPWASWLGIGVGRGLPAGLQALTAGRAWGFITAWNPQAQRQSMEYNLAAQGELLEALLCLPAVAVLPGLGVGASDWCEPSLFAIGAEAAMLDALGERHRQLAYVQGRGTEPAQLRWLRGTA